MEMGAGTFHTATFLRAVGPEPWSAAYVQPSRRPTDGRYGNNPFRLQHYYQFQVCIKPSPDDFQELYLGSLRSLGFDLLTHDIRFVEDNWESPTLGAWGLGLGSVAQRHGGLAVHLLPAGRRLGCRPVMGEITYGLERLGMYIQGKESIYDIVWTEGPFGAVTYGDVFHQMKWSNPPTISRKADTHVLFGQFDIHEAACLRLLQDKLVLPRLRANGEGLTLVQSPRCPAGRLRHGSAKRFILRVRTLARGVAEAYRVSREALGFPLLRHEISPEAA